ncbi:protein Hook homolog 3 [Drosophila tropicalis]|uniref:protein Hook homolog 3 n=1 Tax=Drosophila tropicalis TaxID=46794 RepID=UPI0035ABEAA6
MERPSSSAMQMIYAELAAAKAQIVRLEEENILLRHRINRASTDHHSNATVHVEAKIRAFQLEEERDRILDTLQTHKKKYNTLHNAYLEKVTRCKALEEMFKRQKTLTGLVMKSAVDQRNAEQQIMLEKRKSAQSERNEVDELQAKLSKLQKALDESYDIIDEMDFELESVDLLEMQNQSLRNEVSALKTKLEQAQHQQQQQQPSAPVAHEEDDDPPPKYEEEDADAHRRYRQHVASSTCECCLKDDDADPETIERAALTNSLIETVEAESNTLRRELLRSRYQRAIRAKLDKESEDKVQD